MIDLDVLATAPALHAFTVDEWQRMGERGLFAPDDRLELLSGVVLEMAPIGPRHMDCVISLNHTLVRGAGSVALVSVQNPVRLDERSEPVPDFALLRLRSYRERLPEAADVLLIIEVADSTLAFDIGPKARAYARAGIPETWVVDLAGARVVRFADPEPDGYRSQREARAGDVIAPAALPRCGVELAGLFPRQG